MNNNSTGIYLGMDVSEKSIELFALSADNKTERKGKIENNPAKIKAFLAGLKNTSKLTVALETGTHSPWLSKMLEEHGCKVFVGHPESYELYGMMTKNVTNEMLKCLQE